MTKFIIFTYSFEGLPLALRMREQGADVRFAVMDYKTAKGEEKEFADYEEEKQFADSERRRLSIGDGLFKKTDAREIFKNRGNLKNYYFVFDMNFGGGIADILRKEGFKVFGGGSLGWKIEEDRKFGMEFMKKNYGIEPPFEMEYGENSVDKAIADVGKMEEKAFVLKPDKVIQTFLPRNQNILKARMELLQFMEGNREKLNQVSFILQEKIYGYEVAVEMMYSNGEPVFAHLDLETKRKYDDELGQLVGCAGDLSFRVDLDSEIVKIGCAPFYKFAKAMNYTGPHDINIIFKDKKRYYGLEFCGMRFGWNDAATWQKMVKMPVAEYFAGIMDGKISEDNLETENYGASVRIFNDNDEKENIGYEVGEPRNVWLSDAKIEDGKLKTAGFDDVLAYFTGVSATPEEAFKEVYDEIDDAIIMPNQYWRRDLDKNVYPNPLYRFYRLKEMGLF